MASVVNVRLTDQIVGQRVTGTVVCYFTKASVAFT